MMFLLGIIVGILICIFIALVLLFLRHPIEKNIDIAETAIKNKSPRPRGFVFDPPTEAEESRAEIIEKNKAEGKDTHISELI